MKFKIFRTRFDVSYALLCLVAVCIILGVFKSFLWCAGAVAVHECGHLTTMIHLGYFPERIKIALFSIDIIDGERQSRSVRKNLLIIFFGPFFNFICFLVCFLLYLRGISVVLPFAASNASVGLFNLLPVMSLDGGQLAYLLLSRAIAHDRAEKAVDALTFAFIFPLAAMGFWLMLKSKNVSLLFVSVYLVFSLLFKGNRFY